ncbi:hypothetical protein F2P79_003290 [Pimephales promelas]|nr:hypothetical protein F2P79_003290 [Pimephales promelas]
MGFELSESKCTPTFLLSGLRLMKLIHTLERLFTKDLLFGTGTALSLLYFTQQIPSTGLKWLQMLTAEVTRGQN